MLRFCVPFSEYVKAILPDQFSVQRGKVCGVVRVCMCRRTVFFKGLAPCVGYSAFVYKNC